MLSALSALPRRHPLLFSMAVCSCNATAADAIVQRFVERRPSLDTSRLATFAAFGVAYLGGWQYALQVRLFSAWFPSAPAFVAKPLGEKLRDRAGQLTVLRQVFVDLFLNHPLTYFPCFYATQRALQTGSVAGWAETYAANAADDLAALWTFWLPAQTLNFSVCPMWLRVPFVSSLSLLWTCVLSCKRGAAEVAAEPLQPARASREPS